MDKIKALFVKYKQFILFCMVGGINTVIAFGVFSVLMLFLPDEKNWILAANTIGDICGAVNSYCWNRFIIFKAQNSKNPEKKEKDWTLIRFAITFSIFLLLSNSMMYLFTEVLNVNKFLSKIIVIPVTTVVNFFMNKLFAFRKKD